MLIESTKFKRKCENSNKVLHDLLKPGYDYTLVDTGLKTEQESPVVSKNDFSCQTDEPEPIEVIHKVDERLTEEIFEDGMQYYKLKTKVDQAYTHPGDEFIDLCNQYACFDPKAENFCQISGCDERILTVVALQSHMRTKHFSLLRDFIEKWEAEENETRDAESDSNKDEIQSREKYTITENNEVIQVEEYEEELYFQEMEDETKPVDEEIKPEQDDQVLELTNVSYHCPICHKVSQFYTLLWTN